MGYDYINCHETHAKVISQWLNPNIAIGKMFHGNYRIDQILQLTYYQDEVGLCYIFAIDRIIYIYYRSYNTLIIINEELYLFGCC